MDLEGLRLRGYPASFADAIRPIQHELGGLWWLIHGTPVGGCGSRGEPAPDWDAIFMDYLVAADESRGLSLFAPGFATRYAAYIWGGCCDEVIGLPSRIQLSRVPAGFPHDGEKFVHDHAAIALACLDGTHWRMFTPNDRWRETFCATFPAAEPCSLHARDEVAASSDVGDVRDVRERSEV